VTRDEAVADAVQDLEDVLDELQRPYLESLQHAEGEQ
jgi:hypothetical protein